MLIGRIAPPRFLQGENNLIEDSQQRGAQRLQCSERGNGNQRSQQAVLNHGGPVFVTTEPLHSVDELFHRHVSHKRDGVTTDKPGCELILTIDAHLPRFPNGSPQTSNRTLSYATGVPKHDRCLLICFAA